VRSELSTFGTDKPIATKQPTSPRLRNTVQFAAAKQSQQPYHRPGHTDATTVPRAHRAHGDAEELSAGTLIEQAGEPQITELGIGNPPEFPAARRGFSACCTATLICVNVYYVK